jgi:outer membrane protein, heavy metal efflux system
MKRSLLFVFVALFLWTHVCHGQTILSAQDAVAFALPHRPELRAANDRVSASEHLRSQAGLIPNPRFLFRKEDFANHLNLGENSQTYWEGEQLLETSGKRGERIAVAQQGIEQSRLQAELERRQIVLNVRESYWKAKAAQSLAALYGQDADYFRQVIEYHEARFREGKIAEVDLSRVRLQGEQIRAAAANARLDSEKALLMLAEEMNARPTIPGYFLRTSRRWRNRSRFRPERTPYRYGLKASLLNRPLPGRKYRPSWQRLPADPICCSLAGTNATWI